MSTYYIDTNAECLYAQDEDEARKAFERWVLRNGRSDQYYWLVKGTEKDGSIHAGDITTNPGYHADPVDTQGRYVHNNGDGTFSAWRDGYQEYSRFQHTSYEAAAKALFPSWAGGGYNALYYPMDAQDHDISGFGPVCAECACADWLENGTNYHVENDDGEERYLNDITCAVCNEIITKQICAECGSDLVTEDDIYAGLPEFYTEEGRGVHGTCLIKLVQNREMIKSGLQEYRPAPASSHWFTKGPLRARRGA